MTPSSKAKVLTDAELIEIRDYREFLDLDAAIDRLLATINALKAELALKDKVVEAARKARDDLRRGQPRTAALRLDEALNDLDKVMAR